ncbi:succinylglutamate desuccinylase/aspartoacylase family protein [Motilimonas sp. KMU-193]|uniref:succinylglutamate desuccinylase/aspartoacylase family protein n=1 Tax=Motilimonas sp. KMU-193 TaxID=3388668 RepID=UPI00396B2392
MARAKKNKVFNLLGEQILPGQRKQLDLEAAKLYTHSTLDFPVEVINGVYQGPVLMVCAAIHGDELNGVEVVRQLLAKINPQQLKGTLVAVPVVNVFGFIHKSRYLPDRRDLNRCFPGSSRGSLGSRMAHVFFDNLVKHCTHIIDLHTGAIHRTNLPQIRANLSNEATNAMAFAFGTPVIIDASLRDGSLRSEAENLDIPVITYEAGEALRFDPIAITGGLRGVVSVMRSLGMLRMSRKQRASEPVIARSSSWVRAESDGIVRSQVSLGERVSRGQVLAYISAPLGVDESTLKAPRSGIVIGQQTLPLVNEGDAVFHIAFFSEPDKHVEQQVETFIGEMLDIEDEHIRAGYLGENS